MKIQCDVCEKAPPTVICCADEAALCANCDLQVHAANKLASKHRRLLLQPLSNKLPPCDICQEKTAFMFCVEDRALFCKDCDEPIHSPDTRAANHRRFLATGIRVYPTTPCAKETSFPNHFDPKSNPQRLGQKAPPQDASSSSWAADDLLRFSDYESSNKKEQLELNELEWLAGINLFSEDVCKELAIEVPQCNSTTPFRPAKKCRIEFQVDDDEEEYFTVPDLG